MIKGDEPPLTPDLPEAWQIRPCKIYDEEYSDCTRIQSRFQQYFVEGKTADCSQWKKDFENCVRYEEKRDLKAARELIESEKARRMERFRGHYQNDVWKKRDKCPDDWDAPLPEKILEGYKNSFLDVKARQMKGEKVEVVDPQESSCVIM